MVRVLISCRQGYTFVELLVALTIFSLLAVPLLGIFSTSALFITGSALQTTAANLGRDQMEKVKALGFEKAFDLYDPENDSLHIEENIPGHPGFRRETSTAIITLAGGNTGPGELELLLVRVAVYWSMRNQEHSIILESYLCER